MVHRNIRPASGLETNRVVLVDDGGSAVSQSCWRGYFGVHMGTGHFDVRLGGRNQTSSERHLGFGSGRQTRPEWQDAGSHRAGAELRLHQVVPADNDRLRQ